MNIDFTQCQTIPEILEVLLQARQQRVELTGVDGNPLTANQAMLAMCRDIAARFETDDAAAHISTLPSDIAAAVERSLELDDPLLGLAVIERWKQELGTAIPEDTSIGQLVTDDEANANFAACETPADVIALFSAYFPSSLSSPQQLLISTDGLAYGRESLKAQLRVIQHWFQAVAKGEKIDKAVLNSVTSDAGLRDAVYGVLFDGDGVLKDPVPVIPEAMITFMFIQYEKELRREAELRAAARKEAEEKRARGEADYPRRGPKPIPLNPKYRK